MAYGQSDDTIIQEEVFDTIQFEVSALAWQLDDAIDKCYHNKLSKKATMQIER